MKSFEITVFGQLQGIGYRTFIADYAEEHGIKGAVRNSGGAVKLHVVINPDDMSKLSYHLRYNCPANGRVENIIVRPLEKSLPAEDFRIIKSDDFDEGARFLPPDIGICPDCMREVLDPADRRYRYPFISCNVCGPRYSVMKRAPYDRINLTFDDFPMCQECIDDYREKGNRHRHAETIGCKNCGPMLFSPGNKQLIWRADWFRKTVYLGFMDREIPCPAGYDPRLTCQYGDYMTPVHAPSRHGRLVINLKESYQKRKD